MLEAVELRCSQVRLEAEEFPRVLKALADSGWVAAALESRNRFFELAGVEATDARGATVRAQDRANYAAADVFFRDDGVYYITNVSPELAERLAIGGGSPEFLLERYLVAGGTHGAGELVIGVVTPEGDDLPGRLSAFADAAEKAVTASLDGRRTRHMKFTWVSSEPEGRLSVLCRRLEAEGAVPTFTQASLDTSVVERADTLADRGNRELIRELAAAGFARTADILARRGRKEEEVKRALAELTTAGLIRAEYVLQCRSSSALLTKLSSAEKLKEPAFSELACATCNRKFADELLVEGYSVAPEGRELTNGSHWMTIWVTKRLTDLGVPIELITWNLSESTEEIDILIDFLDRLWIIELKDREFGPGDAHPFNYRRVRYRADEALVITTDKVSNDAKKVLDDLAKESRSRSRTGTKPELVEGLDKVEAHLRGNLDRAAKLRARARLAAASALIGFDLSGVLDRRYAGGA